MSAYRCSNERKITGDDIAAFADYCVDVNARLEAYGLTPQRALMIADHIDTMCESCKSAIENYLESEALSDELELTLGPAEELSFEDDSMGDLYRACREMQDKKRILRNEREHGFSTVASVAEFMLSYMLSRSGIPSEDIMMEAKLGALQILGESRGYIQDCPSMEILGRYKYGLLENGELDFVNSHLEQCDICAHAMGELDRADEAKPKQHQNRNRAGD